ncbi:hypothetical protein K8R32_03680 [bacterium]|nr:hypothetical protein [bacterium]
MHHKIAQLILTPARKTDTTGDITVAQPDANKEALAGKLFILTEIKAKNSTGLKILNFLLDTIQANYYQNEKIILRERTSILKVEHIFEASLSKTNKQFGEYLHNEKIKRNQFSINITVGIIHEEKLYFANSGKNKIFLIYESRNEKNDKTIKIVDIAKKSNTEEQKPNDLKLFSNVVSGEIPNKGIFFITNEALPEYITNKQLIGITTKLPPMSAIEQIKSTLSKINNYVSFLGLIIKSTAIKSLESKKINSTTSTQGSISDLNRTEETTENLLTPSGLVSPKRWMKILRLNSSPTVKKTAQDSSYGQQLAIKDKIFVKKKTFYMPILKKVLATLKNIAIHASNALFFIFKTTANKNNIKKIYHKESNQLKLFWNRIIAMLAGMTKKSKFLLIILFVVLVLFGINIFSAKRQQAITEERENYSDVTALIEQKQNQAEANLLYSNEEGALKLFAEITELMNSLPQKTEEQKLLFEQFNTKFNQQLEILRQVVHITELKDLANFKNLNSSADSENIIMIDEKNKLFAADSSQKSIYILDTNNLLATTLMDLEQPISTLHYPAQNSQGNIYYLNGSSIIELNSETETLSTIAITLTGAAENIVDIEIYNNRFYLLDTDKKQIYRYNKSGQNLSAAYAWVRETIELGGAIDLSIDGHVYVLKKDATVLKLLRGTRQDFALEKIDPALEQPTRLFVSPDDKFIYILEPSTNRLVIFDKTGQFLIQYKFDNLSDLKDFSVDEKNKLVYLLNSNNVVSFSPPHFNEEKN